MLNLDGGREAAEKRLVGPTGHRAACLAPDWAVRRRAGALAAAVLAGALGACGGDGAGVGGNTDGTGGLALRSGATDGAASADHPVPAGPPASAEVAAKAAAALAPSYTVVNLAIAGESLDAPFPQNRAINAAGQVVLNGNGRAWLHDQGVFRPIDAGISGAVVQANGLNARGEVVGDYAEAAAGRVGPFLWSAPGGLARFEPLPAGVGSATAIGDGGHVLLNDGGSQPPRAYRWSRVEGLREVVAPAAGPVRAIAVDARGRVAAQLYRPGTYAEAFFWSPATGAVSLDPGFGDSTWVAAMSNAGRIVGYGLYSPWTAFAWTLAGGLAKVPHAPNEWTRATDLNEAGDVIGTRFYTRVDEVLDSFVWRRDGRVVPLGSLGGTQVTARAINEAGVVVGSATDRDGRMRAFAWTPATGMVDLNARLASDNGGLELRDAVGIADDGRILAHSNAGLVLLGAASAAPSLGPITGPATVAVGREARFAVSFSDADRSDTHAATWHWGDGSPAQAGTVAQAAGGGTSRASHVFERSGVYTVTVRIADSAGMTTSVAREVVVYDPSAGFVTGAGWLQSPAGAYRPDPTRSGPAQFAFVSMYLPGSATPDGLTAFRFRAAGLELASDEQSWLLVSGRRARFEGRAKVNGRDGYRFAITAVDGREGGARRDGDRFRIRIWQLDAARQREVVLYDNQLVPGPEGSDGEGAVIEGGRIVVHRPGRGDMPSVEQ